MDEKKTVGQVACEAHNKYIADSIAKGTTPEFSAIVYDGIEERWNRESERNKSAWEAAAHAACEHMVKQLQEDFGAASSAPNPTKLSADHVHEFGSCSYCDTAPKAITIPTKPTRPLRAELVDQIKARLSPICKCGHDKVEDHVHGECEVDDCKCIMPELCEELESDDALLQQALDCMENS